MVISKIAVALCRKKVIDVTLHHRNELPTAIIPNANVQCHTKIITDIFSCKLSYKYL